MERINTKKTNNQNSSVFEVLRYFSYCLNVTDPLIIPFIFIFLPCHEKDCDNKEFSHENSKPFHESQITTH